MKTNLRPKRRSKLKIILLSILIPILSILLIGVITVYFYYPKYLINEDPLETTETHSGITIMSANVRTYTPTDFMKRSWYYRAHLFNDDLAQVNPDIVGFQEATVKHYKYFTKVLKNYDSTIAYRDDSKGTEGCPIFFKKDKFELVEDGHFWLSETPSIMSKDPNSSYYRICSYAILKDKVSQTKLIVFNTHLDINEKARINSIKIVLDKINDFGGYPSFLMGDFNDFIGSKTINSSLEYFDDSQKLAKITDDGCTYQDWGNKLSLGRIDFIMLSKNTTNMKINLFNILQKEETTHPNVYASDHYPIYINITIS